MTYSTALKHKSEKVEADTKMDILYTKSHSNISTTSIESGIFEMDQQGMNIPAVGGNMSKNIGDTVRDILVEAQSEKRLVVGLKGATQFLMDTEHPEHSLFCFLAPSRDHGTHMNTVLLKAYCFDNDIYTVELDCAEKLGQILGCKRSETCALIQRSSSILEEQQQDDQEEFTEIENQLIDHCEEFWNHQVQPIIKLPEK